MSNWIWTVTKENWPIIKNEKVWTISASKKTELVKKGDKIIFYVKGSLCFYGIYEIINDWHDSKTDWNDIKAIGTGKKNDVDLEEIQLGFAVVGKLSKDLEFIKKSAFVGMYLRSHGKLGRSNFGKPITDNDYKIILEELKRVQKEPIILKSKQRKKSKLADKKNINWELLTNIDLKGSRFSMMKKFPDPFERAPTNIEKIIEKAQNGEWLIPNFQRNYSWSHEHVRELLTSIFMESYIGSLLLWDPEEDEKLDSLPVHGVKTNPNRHTEFIVLDGQQRITSLNYAINPPKFTKKDDKKRFPGYFYVDLSVFLEGSDPEDMIIRSTRQLDYDETIKLFWFPFYELNTNGINRWIDYLMDTFDEKNPLKFKIYEIGSTMRDKLFRILSQFQIPYIVLPKSTDFDSVATIFENLNSKGMQLGTFDLLNARLNRYGIPLKELWASTLDDYGKIKEYFEDKPEMIKINLYIIEAISLAFTELKSCKQKDILNLFTKKEYNAEEFKQHWTKMSKFVQLAIDRLEDKNGYGILTKKEIPYESTIPVIAALMCVIKNDFKDHENECMEKLDYWYWSVVFGSRYVEGSGSKKTIDFKHVLQWFKYPSDIPFFIRDLRSNYESKIQLMDVQKKNDSIYRGIFSLLNKNGADDSKQKIIMDKKTPHKDHIFPKSKFKHADGWENSILNMTYLTKETNSEKSNKLPSEYISEVIKEAYDHNEEKFLKILERHFMDKQCLKYLKRDEFEKFLTARRNIMYRHIGIAIGADV